MKYENETIRLVRKHKRTRARVPDGSSSGAIPREPRRAAVERPSKAPRRARARTRLEPSDTDPRTRRDANTTRRKQSNTTYQLRASLLVLRRVHDESRRFASAVDASACLGLQKHPSHEESRTVVSHHTQTSTPKLPPLFALDDASASATTTSTVDASSFDRSRSRRSAIQIFPHAFPSRVASRHPSTAAPADPSKVAPTSSSSRARERGCRARIMCRVSCRFTCRANVPATSGRAWSAEENVSEACMLIPDVCRAWTWTRVTSRSSSLVEVGLDVAAVAALPPLGVGGERIQKSSRERSI